MYYKFTKRCDPVQLALIFSPAFHLVQMKSDLLNVQHTPIGVSIQYVKGSIANDEYTIKFLEKCFENYLTQYFTTKISRVLPGIIACAIKLFKVITSSVK